MIRGFAFVNDAHLGAKIQGGYQNFKEVQLQVQGNVSSIRRKFH